MFRNRHLHLQFPSSSCLGKDLFVGKARTEHVSLPVNGEAIPLHSSNKQGRFNVHDRLERLGGLGFALKEEDRGCESMTSTYGCEEYFMKRNVDDDFFGNFKRVLVCLSFPFSRRNLVEKMECQPPPTLTSLQPLSDTPLPQPCLHPLRLHSLQSRKLLAPPKRHLRFKNRIRRPVPTR